MTKTERALLTCCEDLRDALMAHGRWYEWDSGPGGAADRLIAKIRGWPPPRPSVHPSLIGELARQGYYDGQYDSMSRKNKSGATPKRKTHRSSKGKKLYAFRDSKGRFKDIVTYQRLHRAELRQKEPAAAKKRKKGEA